MSQYRYLVVCEECGIGFYVTTSTLAASFEELSVHGCPICSKPEDNGKLIITELERVTS